MGGVSGNGRSLGSKEPFGSLVATENPLPILGYPLGSCEPRGTDYAAWKSGRSDIESICAGVVSTLDFSDNPMNSPKCLNAGQMTL